MRSPKAAVPRIDHVTPDGVVSIRKFLSRVPRGEYLFLKDDLGDPGVVDAWLRNGARIFLAYLEDEVAGLLALIPGHGWSRHVGEFRMVVDPVMRGRGVGAALARQGLVAAMTAQLEKVSVEILAEQEGVAALFRDLGFTPEALLTDQVRDAQGRLHDLLVLSHRIEPTWSALSTLGMVEGETEQ